MSKNAPKQRGGLSPRRSEVRGALLSSKNPSSKVLRDSSTRTPSTSTSTTKKMAATNVNTKSKEETSAGLVSSPPDASDNENKRYETVERGQLHTLNYRCYFRDRQTQTFVSPFHDIPLMYKTTSNDSTNPIFNMIVEVPRWTNAKMEINKQLKLNPIVQDIKNNKPRFVHNVFPYHGYLWNYGALPQTWEDPNHTDSDTKTTGDNDPLDVCEIGTKLHSTGSIVPVKIVGVLGLIDEGETDWKLIGIDINDKLASKIDDINDVEQHLPGLLDATRRWFKYYKVPTGKPPNVFALNEQFADKKYAMRVIEETRKYWEKLASGETKVPEKVCSIANTTLKNAGTVGKDEAEKIVNENEEHKQPAKVDVSVHDLAYVVDNEKRAQ